MEILELSKIKIGDVLSPSSRMHADFPRLHTIQGLRKHAAEEKTLTAKIDRWSKSHKWTCVEKEAALAVLVDRANRRFAVGASLLVHA